jgi:hypothetical protein
MTTQAYLKEFMNNVDVVACCGGTIGTSPRLSMGLATKRSIDRVTTMAMTVEEKNKIKVEARERYLATVFILGADRRRYNGLICDIENNYLNGTNKYPKTMTSAFNLLVNWKGDPTRITRHRISDGVAFTIDGVALTTLGRPRRDVSTVECHNCCEMGHYAYDCKKPKKQTGDQLLMSGIMSGEFDAIHDLEGFSFFNEDKGLRSVGTTLNNDSHGRIPKTWILLDNQSTVDVFHNPDLLKNIRVS